MLALVLIVAIVTRYSSEKSHTHLMSDPISPQCLIMSHNGSNNSESSSSSPNQTYFLLDTKTDSVDLTRSGTVRRVSSASKKDVEVKEINEELETMPLERVRKSLDSTYRLSLESIHEYKPITTTRHSVDSSSSDCTEFADKDDKDKTLMSQSSSYLSWIESVSASGGASYFGSSAINTDFQDCDNKVGEWNNFWLNYNSARTKYLSSPYLNLSQEENKTDDLSEVKSTCSTQRDITDKNSTESITLSVEEVNEALRCSQRVTEILQNALRRTDQDLEESFHSYYSQSFTRHNSSIRDIDMVHVAPRERSFSYAVDAHDLQKQKLLFKNTPQSSSTSCINALLNTGVGDILKRVITKRKDFMSSSEDNSNRGNFPDWSSTK